MKPRSGGRWALCLGVALVLAWGAPLCLARSGSKADKHAQKMEKKLSKYKSGTVLHLEFADNTESLGTVIALSKDSFTFSNSDTNAKETHLYRDVSHVEKGKEYFGAGAAPKHHIHIF